MSVVLDSSLANNSSGAALPWSAYGIALGAVAQKTGYVGDYSGELAARKILTEVWKKVREDQTHRYADAYLDALVTVADAGFIREYVLSFLARPGWVVPAQDVVELKLVAFKEWIPGHLGRQHHVQTRAKVAAGPNAAEPPVPGADLVGMDPQRVPCASLEPEIARAVDAWDAAEAHLGHVPVSVSSTEEMLPALQLASRDARARRDGVVLVSPLVANTMFTAGFCAVERRAFPEAERYLRRAVALSPANANIRGELVQTLIVQKRLDDADAELDAALPLAVSPCHLAVLWRKRGYILFDRGKLVDSYQAYAHSLEFDPESAIAHREMQLIVSELRRSGGYDEKVFKDSGPPPPGGMTVKVCH